MKVYIDSDYKCHTTNSEGIYREAETNFFEGKCTEIIECYRFVPNDESWTRSDGAEFRGEMIAPWKDPTELDAVQREYERKLLAEYAEALRTMGVKV